MKKTFDELSEIASVANKMILRDHGPDADLSPMHVLYVLRATNQAEKNYKAERDALIKLFVEWWFYEPNNERGRSESNANFFNLAVKAVPDLADAIRDVLHNDK